MKKVECCYRVPLFTFHLIKDQGLFHGCKIIDILTNEPICWQFHALALYYYKDRQPYPDVLLSTPALECAKHNSLPMFLDKHNHISTPRSLKLCSPSTCIVSDQWQWKIVPCLRYVKKGVTQPAGQAFAFWSQHGHPASRTGCRCPRRQRALHWAALRILNRYEGFQGNSHSPPQSPHYVPPAWGSWNPINMALQWSVFEALYYVKTVPALFSPPRYIYYNKTFPMMHQSLLHRVQITIEAHLLLNSVQLFWHWFALVSMEHPG